MENYVGKRLDGRYEIMEIIGVGGMAVVYKAFDNIDNRIVAIKILKQEYLSNDEFKRRFKNESKAIAVLSHNNIVKVFDVSFGDVIQYIVMEYVDGITLKEYIKQQRAINIRESIYFITQILSALQHAHDKGIVHRDIKPQNIMLISDGSIKVTDFGIARFSENETRTMTDGAIGSVHYISPEQAKGSLTDAKTDVYSCGVMLYEMLTGKLPFQSDNAVSVALMQLQENPVNPREINPHIPVGLEEIIIKAMQKNQNDRYQSAKAMLYDIRAFIKNPSVVFGYTYGQVPASETEQKTQDSTAYKTTEESVSEPAADFPDDEFEDFDKEIKKKKISIAILTVMLVGMIVSAVVLAVKFLPLPSIVSVPNLVGMNYADVENNPEYNDFIIEPEYEKSDEPNGTILRQDPKSGRMKEGGTIKIYVAGSGSEIEIPDVSGYQSSSAVKVLKQKGFNTVILKEKSELDPGTVIRTVPSSGQRAPAGSTIEIYIATNKDVEPVNVPNLVGMTIPQARQALQEVGLLLDDANSVQRPSSEPYGKIIGYDKIGEQVLPGTKIAVVVSSGMPEETTEEETTEETTQTTKPTDRVTTLPPEELTTAPTTTAAPPPVEESTTQESTTAPTETTTTEPTTTAPPVEIPEDITAALDVVNE